MLLEPHVLSAPPAPSFQYSQTAPADLLRDRNVLAVMSFGVAQETPDDPRLVPVHLAPWQASDICEVWRVGEPVTCGHDEGVQWAMGGSWMLVALEQPDDGRDARGVAHAAYCRLTNFLRRQPDYHVLRLWNHIDRINDGAGDAERYRQFCAGRLEGMKEYFRDGFPAATAIGHAKPAGSLQLYCLAARTAGTRIENPRQLSAWCYPRQYGPVSPSFARGMRLPAGDGLAISGTAAICGHASRHHDDLEAQLAETSTNLRSLLAAAGMEPGFTPQSPLKAYVRHRENMPAVDAFLAEYMPEAPRLLLQADICRSELLVEIDGWHTA